MSGPLECRIRQEVVRIGGSDLRELERQERPIQTLKLTVSLVAHRAYAELSLDVTLLPSQEARWAAATCCMHTPWAAGIALSAHACYPVDGEETLRGARASM